MLILNVIVLLGLLGLHWYLSSKKGWFKHRHVALSQTGLFAITIGSLFVPVTPFVIDGMIFGSLLYFGAEWVYQKFRWSPVTELAGQAQETDARKDVA